MKSVKHYARQKLEGSTPAVHLLYDIDIRINSNNFCGDLEAKNGTTLAEPSRFEQADTKTDIFNEDISEVQMFDAIDEATATLYNLTSVRNPYKTFHGRLQPDFQRVKQKLHRVGCAQGLFKMPW